MRSEVCTLPLHERDRRRAHSVVSPFAQTYIQKRTCPAPPPAPARNARRTPPYPASHPPPRHAPRLRLRPPTRQDPVGARQRGGAHGGRLPMRRHMDPRRRLPRWARRPLPAGGAASRLEGRCLAGRQHPCVARGLGPGGAAARRPVRWLSAARRAASRGRSLCLRVSRRVPEAHALHACCDYCCDHTRHLVKAFAICAARRLRIPRFVYLSSLSVPGKVVESRVGCDMK